jgi:anaerobic magnesium-protoporphyrin IX monomethyl ester cyclase
LRSITLIRPPVVHLKRDFYGSIPGIPAGLAYLAASVRQAGAETSILDGYGMAPHRFYTFRDDYRARGLTPDEIASMLAGKDTVAGISVHCATEHSMAIAISRAIKERSPGTPVIVGGYHATFVPRDYIDSGVDYVVMGEGEKRLPALLEFLDGGEGRPDIEGVASVHGVTERENVYSVDLEKQPFAAVDLLPLQNYWELGYSHGPFAGRYMNILTSRGCPYTCSFCQAPAMCGGRWNAKSAGRVLEEVRLYVDEYDIHDFHIQDENFALDRKRVQDICSGLIREGIDITFCFPSGLKMETLDEELLDLMGRAGCRYFSLSPETGSRRVLELMGKTADIDRVPGLVKKAVSIGTSTCAFFVTGYPGETKDDRRETGRYITRLARAGVDEVIMPILTPFPATEAMKEPSLQGFKEYDQLCFSPVWRSDYRELDRFRKGVYARFYAVRLLFHPLKVLGQLFNIFTGQAATKSEMTARRLFRDLYDRFFRKSLPRDIPQ